MHCTRTDSGLDLARGAVLGRPPMWVSMRVPVPGGTQKEGLCGFAQILRSSNCCLSGCVRGGRTSGGNSLGKATAQLCWRELGGGAEAGRRGTVQGLVKATPSSLGSVLGETGGDSRCQAKRDKVWGCVLGSEMGPGKPSEEACEAEVAWGRPEQAGWLGAG